MIELTRRNCIAMLAALLLAAATTNVNAQMGTSPAGAPPTDAPGAAKKMPSPPAHAAVMLMGKTITIDYSAPSMRGRKIAGGLVPYDKVWRTGANAATTLKTPINLKIGTLAVAAGTYTIYSLPAEAGWKLIINKQTGQWGTVYDESKDLGRTDMMSAALPEAVETMVIKFDKVQKDSAEMHILWEKSDLSVQISAE